MSLLPYLERETGQPVDASVIWLHGLGADGHDFDPIVPELRLPDSARIRFIFPHAPKIPVTVNGGMVMPAWYDIKAMDLERHLDTDQLQSSADAVRALIDQEIERGIPAERIILAGFSQGGAVAYLTALTYPDRLAGLLTLSTYLAVNPLDRAADANRDLPILACHGRQDPMVPEFLGRQAVETLEAAGYPVQYRTYDVEHGVCLEEVRDIGTWLQQRLGLGD
ncbi:dienelactone hydrolase family protein [Marinobacteraceae bacterium S3BR75-40.1]